MSRPDEVELPWLLGTLGRIGTVFSEDPVQGIAPIHDVLRRAPEPPTVLTCVWGPSLLRKDLLQTNSWVVVGGVAVFIDPREVASADEPRELRLPHDEKNVLGWALGSGHGGHGIEVLPVVDVGP